MTGQPVFIFTPHGVRRGKVEMEFPLSAGVLVRYNETHTGQVHKSDIETDRTRAIYRCNQQIEFWQEQREKLEKMQCS